LQRVPIGVAGELHVGGESMARGYHDQPGLVADRFIPDPFEPAGARLYKTGDLARYLPDGNIEFLGRIDNQVKLRGFRIELGEIESVLGQHSAVRHNTVVAHVDATGERRLVAYVVPEPGERAVAAELEHHLRERLPDYMVPAAFCCLESIPVTANGKLDHDRLPEPDHSGQTPTDHALPRTAMERKIAGVWCDVLRREEVGVHDNFFHLGGHSLLMARVCTQLRRLLQRDIALVDLFQHPTVGALAAHLGRRTDQEPEVAVPPSRRQAHGRRESIESVRALKQMARRSHPDSR